MIALLTSLLLIASSSFAQDFKWGFGGIQLHGPKKQVMELSENLALIFNTDDGERLINFFKQHKKIIHTSELGQLSLLTSNPNDSFEFLNEFYLNNSKAQKPLIFRPEQNEQVTTSWGPYPFITVKGSKTKLARMLTFLDKINATQLGSKLFNDMSSCSKELLIYDDKHSLSGGGYTAAKKSSSGIFEGRGEDAYIRFRFDQPNEGSHLVQTTRGGAIPFTYIDNIFHELVHAKHIMCGTMSKFGAEHQAIEEENLFRKSRSESAHLAPRDPDQYEEGQQVWFGLFF